MAIGNAVSAIDDPRVVNRAKFLFNREPARMILCQVQSRQAAVIAPCEQAFSDRNNRLFWHDLIPRAHIAI